MRTSSPARQMFATLTVFAALAAGCGDSGDSISDEPAAATTTIAATRPTTTATGRSIPTTTLPAEDGGIWWQRALDGEYERARVELVAHDHDPSRYSELADRVEALTGIRLDVRAEQGRDLLIADIASGGGHTDIAAVMVSDALALADMGLPIDVREPLGESWLANQYGRDWLDAATVPTAEGNVMAGVIHRYGMGNVVFYPVDDFEAAGYPVPATWQQMVDLSQTIITDGGTPWCIGIEMEPVTGWMVTPWLEDILLRTSPMEDHERWIRDRLDFDSPQLAGALDVLSEIWLGEGFVAGGPAAAARTNVEESVLPMFDAPPGCWFHLQRPWIADSFPAGAEFGHDYDFFLVPPIDGAQGTPMAAPMTMMVMLEDRPEVRAVMAYLAQPESAAPWVEGGEALSPHRGTSLVTYPSPLAQALATAMADVDGIRPTVTHAGRITANATETRQLLTEFVAGQRTAGDVLALIDDPTAVPPPPPPPPPRSGHIVDLIAEGAIQATPRGAGIDDLDLDLENLLDELLDVEIPPGTFFVAGSGGVQNMVVRTGRTIELGPNELLRAVLDVACANLERDIPDDDDRFVVERQRSDSTSRLMQVLDAADVPYAVAQAATWIVSDDADYDDLGILITTPGRTRVIDHADAGEAMQRVDEAGIDITGQRIWRDRDTIASGAGPSFRTWLDQR